MKSKINLDGFLKTCWILIWEAPQNILGLLIFLIHRRRTGKPQYIHHRALIPTKGFGISLGWFVFYPKSDDPAGNLNLKNIKHEYGHAIQSRLLGSLYLPLVGIPSLARILYKWLFLKLHRTPWDGYFLGYPERWADRLGHSRFHDRKQL